MYFPGDAYHTKLNLFASEKTPEGEWVAGSNYQLRFQIRLNEWHAQAYHKQTTAQLHGDANELCLFRSMTKTRLPMLFDDTKVLN